MIGHFFYCGQWPRYSVYNWITHLDIKLQLHFLQLFPLNLWLATYLKGRPSTIRAAVRCRISLLRSACTALCILPSWKPIPLQGVLRHREMFSSPLDSAVRHRVYCSKYRYFVSVWTLFFSIFFLSSAQNISLNLSVGFLAPIFLKKVAISWPEKTWKCEFQWTVWNSASKIVVCRCYSATQQSTENATVTVSDEHSSDIGWEILIACLIQFPGQKNILEKLLWVIFNKKYFC